MTILNIDYREKQILDYLLNKSLLGGARGVIVIVVGSGHGDTSSNPGRD